MNLHKIGNRILLQKSLSRDKWCLPTDPAKVLVIFFPWLGAKEKHIKKYQDLYTEQGLDVLTVMSHNSDFLWPRNSQKLAHQLDKVLVETCFDYQHFLCHAMSAGAYNLTVFTMHSRHTQHSAFLEKVSGIVFDSIVVGSGAAGVIKDSKSSSSSQTEALDQMIKGVATSFSNSQQFHNLVSFLAKAYFKITKKYTLDFYDKSLSVVRDEPIPIPTLVLGSRDDALSNANVTEQLVEIWKKRNEFPVMLHLFDHSPHTQHYVYHKEEYTAIHKQFLELIFRQRNKSNHFDNFLKSKL